MSTTPRNPRAKARSAGTSFAGQEACQPTPPAKASGHDTSKARTSTPATSLETSGHDTSKARTSTETTTQTEPSSADTSTQGTSRRGKRPRAGGGDPSFPTPVVNLAPGVPLRTPGHAVWSRNGYLMPRAGLKRTPDEVFACKRDFLEKLVEAGGSFRTASKLCGVAWQTLYKWRSVDENFAEAWTAVLEGPATDALESEALRRAVDGDDAPVIHQGVITDWYKKRSDILLMFLMKSRRPEKYADSGHAATNAMRSDVPAGTKIFEKIERIIMPAPQRRILEGEVLANPPDVSSELEDPA